MDWTTFDSLVLLGFLGILSKRAIWGPQTMFARLSLAAFIVGGGFVALGAPDKTSWAILYFGGPLLLAGIVLAGAMLVLDIRHMWWPSNREH